MIQPPPHAVEIQPFRPKKLQPGRLPTIAGQSQIVWADGYAYVAVGKHWTIINECDIPIVSGCSWVPVPAPNGRIYVENKKFDAYQKQIVRRLHRVIMNCPQGLYVDHIDSNPLNNVRANLRICTPQQNTLNTRLRSNNTSGFKGVSYRKDRGKWSAQIRVGKDLLRLGCYASPEEAHAAYAQAAKRYFGEFARVA